MKGVGVHPPPSPAWPNFTLMTECTQENRRYYTVIRTDGRIHQAHRMAPDQTIRLMENKFDIYDGYIRCFPTFPMEIFDHLEVFRLYSLFKGWESQTFRRFPIIFPFQRMEISNFSKFSAYIPFS
jgi:hypothetical protein